MCQYTVTRYTCSHVSTRELTARCETALAEGVCGEGIRDTIYTVAEPCPACMTNELLGSQSTYSASEGALQADMTIGAEDGPSRSGHNVRIPSSSVALKSGMDVLGAHSRGINARTPRRHIADESSRFPPEFVVRSQPGMPMSTNEPREVPVLPASVLTPNISSADRTVARTAAVSNAFGPPHTCHPIDRMCNPVYGPCPALVNLRNRQVEEEPVQAAEDPAQSEENPMQAKDDPVEETRTGQHRRAEEEPVRTTRTEREGTARLQIADSVLRARRPERQGPYSVNEVVDSAISLWEQKKRDLDEEEI